MDLLKRELQKKREALQSDFGGRKLLKRSEIEQKRLQKIREQEVLRPLSKSTGPLPPSSAAPSSSSQTASSTSSSKPPKQPLSALADDDERRIDELVLPRSEVVRRLRLLKLPITLFGEDDDARLSRLKAALKSAVVDADSLDMTEGQTNDFLRDIYHMRRRPSASSTFVKPSSDEDGDGEADGDRGKDGDDDGGSSGVDKDMDIKRMKANFEDLCDEDKILVFFKRLLNEWSQELEEMPEAEKRTAKGKSMVATFKQCARYLNPLFKFCRKKVLPDDIRQALLVVVQCCMKRDYLAAMDQYIKLAIGNAPWPIGVTMVGIHERSAREKIYTNSVAHIMNDETTRKYLQSIKRLMTLCQRRYPADPSKSVEFNSLANGSDLQSLLIEEKRGRTSATDENFLLMAPPKD